MMGFEYKVSEEFQSMMGSITNILEPLLSDERQTKLRANLSTRRRDILCVFENTHHCHNISAMLRTLDALGFLESIFVYHAAEMRFKKRDSVERGSSQWLITRRSHSVLQTAENLKKAGYRIALVSLPTFSLTSKHFNESLKHFSADTLHQLENSNPDSKTCIAPIALVLGSELQGISEEWKAHADFYLSVRMHGFVESLNVSVCAGILLHELRSHFEQSNNMALSQGDSALLYEYWLARSTNHARQTIEAQNKKLLDYFDFIKAGKFFDPFPESHLASLALR